VSEWPQFDWAHDPDNDPDENFGENIDKEIGTAAYELLDALSQDVTTLETDEHGWTKADEDGLQAAQETDWLVRLIVPPKALSDMARVDLLELMVEFRTALPWTEAERSWLLDTHRREIPSGPFEVGSPHWREAAGPDAATIMSAGIVRAAYGRDLLQRWWSWRRETGEYEGQGSLEQAREALGGVIALLSPELGLPESYVDLRAARGDEPFTP
jgi:hypothetical protein